MATVALALVACAAVAAVILHPYVTKDLRQPLGWDSMFYVWRARAIGVDGVDRIGAIRAGFPLLTAMLTRATGQSALTMVSVLPAILAGVTALGAAAMSRAAVGMRAAWVPVVGFLTWAAFGPNEIPLHHFDNLLNAALVLAAFAVALDVAEGERGTVAVGLLLAAAGLAHWPFYAVAIAAFVPALLASLWLRSRTGEAIEWGRQPEVRLLGTAAASALFIGPTLLIRPDSGWVGAQPGNLSTLLQQRVQTRLGEPVRFLSFPLAAVGAVALWGGRLGQGADRPRARRLLGLLVAAWGLVTLAAVLAQLAGVPVAGARVLSYFFPATLLTALLVWWVWGRLWTARDARVRALAAVALVATVGGFGLLFWGAWSDRHPWVEERAVRQAATAGRYVSLMAPDAEVVYLLDMRPPRDLATIGRWWLVIKASLPPEQVSRVHRYVGTPEDFVAGRPSLPLGDGLPPGESDRSDPASLGPPAGTAGLAIVLERYNARAFGRLKAQRPEAVVGAGVMILRGPTTSRPLPVAAAATADTGGWNLIVVGAACLAILFVAGAGWSRALVAPDPVLAVLVAPALGLAAATLAALAWALAGIPMGGWWAVGPVAAATTGGWAAAATMRRGRGSEARIPRNPQWNAE